LPCSKLFDSKVRERAENAAQESYDSMQCDAVTIIVTFLSGSVAGAIITNFFDRKNARGNRKIDFLAFINVWESEIVSKDHHKIANGFDSKRFQLVAQATVLESNYRRSALSYFRGLIREITQMTPGQVESEKGNQELLDAIRVLIAFVKRN
jgi:hypothetical protein